MSHNLLDDIFSVKPEHIKTFMEAVRESIQAPEGDMSRIENGSPDRVQAPEQLEQILGFVRVTRGWDGDDYVWHFAPVRNNRPWRVEIGRVVYAVAKTMNQFIPSTVEVKIWLPYQEWDIKEVTFKAMGLKSVWSVSQRDVDQMSERCLEVLNTLL